MMYHLFSLKQCIKCNAVKEYIENREDIKIITFPHNIKEWQDSEIKLAKEYDVFEDLQKTAPILVLDNKTKIIGQLRIIKWVKDNET